MYHRPERRVLHDFRLAGRSVGETAPAPQDVLDLPDISVPLFPWDPQIKIIHRLMGSRGMQSRLPNDQGFIVEWLG